MKASRSPSKNEQGLQRPEQFGAMGLTAGVLKDPGQAFKAREFQEFTPSVSGSEELVVAPEYFPTLHIDEEIRLWRARAVRPRWERRFSRPRRRGARGTVQGSIISLQEEWE